MQFFPAANTYVPVELFKKSEVRLLKNEHLKLERKKKGPSSRNTEQKKFVYAFKEPGKVREQYLDVNCIESHSILVYDKMTLTYELRNYKRLGSDMEEMIIYQGEERKEAFGEPELR